MINPEESEFYGIVNPDGRSQTWYYWFLDGSAQPGAGKTEGLVVSVGSQGLLNRWRRNSLARVRAPSPFQWLTG